MGWSLVLEVAVRGKENHDNDYYDDDDDDDD